MTDVLSWLDFQVIACKDLSADEMDAAVEDFVERLASASYAFFHYSGHGVELEKFERGEKKTRNFLVPIDANFQTKSQANLIRVSLELEEDIIEAMKNSPTELNIISVDACRNNPFPKLASSRAARRKLKKIDVEAGRATLIIGRAASSGGQASDGNGRNGLYTEQLMHFLQKPELEIAQVFLDTTIAVKKKSNYGQLPEPTISPSKKYYLAKGKERGEQRANRANYSYNEQKSEQERARELAERELREEIMRQERLEQERLERERLERERLERERLEQEARRARQRREELERARLSELEAKRKLEEQRLEEINALAENLEVMAEEVKSCSFQRAMEFI